ncbi:MAG TPA: ATPase domain-containing protein [Armatimonadota bacterium]|jgi:KaiC/GvpD/RAD55 family RecA-like ATPase
MTHDSVITDAQAAQAIASRSSALLPLPQVAQVLGISRQRIYQLVKQRNFATVRVDGVLHLGQEDIQTLRQERASTRATPGRKRATPLISGLPRAAKALLMQVLAALAQQLLAPTSLDLFRAALHPRLPLTMANWTLTESVRLFLGDAVALQRQDDVSCTDITLDEARTIYALVALALGCDATALQQEVTLPPAGTASLITIAGEIERALGRLTAQGYAQTASLPLVSATLDFTPATLAYLSSCLLTPQVTVAQLAVLSQRLHGMVTPRYVLADHAVINFLTYGQGLRLAQSLLIFGRWGTGKARLSAQLAVRVALEVQRPVLYVTTESSAQSAVALLETVVLTCCAAGEKVQLVVGAAAPAETAGLPVHVVRAPGNFSFVAQQLLAVVAQHRPAVVVIDSLDGLQDLDRVGLDQLLKSLRVHDVLTIVLAGESDDPTRDTIREQAMSVCDVVLRTRVALPGGAEAMENGLTSYALEVLRSRWQRLADGRHLLTTQERLEIYPALDCWGVPELVALPTRAARVKDDAYQPGFSIPTATPHLAQLDAALASQWMPGGSLALHGGPRTSKDLLSLYACAHALQHGRSCLLLNLRTEYVPMLQAWMREMPPYDCFRVLAEAPCVPFDAETFGNCPALHIWDINPCTVVPEQLLWQISRVLAKSVEQPHPGSLFAWLHFSELLALPRFRAAHDFPVYAMRMLAGFGVSSILSFDADNYQHTLRQANIPDFLPLTDVQFHLRRLEDAAVGEPTIDVRFRSGNFQLLQQQGPDARYLATASKRPADFR